MFIVVQFIFLALFALLFIGIISLGLINRKKIWGKILLLIPGLVGLLILIAIITNWAKSKTVLNKTDYYGEYIIDRNFFSGKQSDWQYNHYRFIITKDDSITFYVTEKEKIIREYKGTITTLTPYSSDRLVINMEMPNHHIMSTNPTTYRQAWDFHLVFYSPMFNNMYFRKGKWEDI
tara:strand:- start:74 stop:604 length:531 start_codon:yes stop_codon:yes gene_type:complete